MADKVYGPKSKALALKKIRSARKMLELAETALESVDYDEDDGSYGVKDTYSERKIVGGIFERTSAMIKQLDALVTHSPIDDPASLADAMRKGLPEEA